MYCTYIITNQSKTVLYTGVTNNLPQRLAEHYFNNGNHKTFTGRYKCCYLLYYEFSESVLDAIYREKEIKGWKRYKKLNLIRSENPRLKFINSEIMDWPPIEHFSRTE